MQNNWLAGVNILSYYYFYQVLASDNGTIVVADVVGKYWLLYSVGVDEPKGGNLIIYSHAFIINIIIKILLML